MGKKYKFDNLGLDHYGYSPRFQKSDDVHPMSQLEGDEEPVKKEKGLKILNTNKLLTRLPVLLAHIKAENLLYQRNKVTTKVYKNPIKSL